MILNFSSFLKTLKDNYIRSFTATAVSFLLSFPSFGQADSDCELRKDEEGIKIYSCKSGQSKYKVIKADFTVNTTLSEFAQVMLDIDQYTTWQYNTVKSRVIKKINEHEVVYYTEISAPWPLNNRDVTVHLTITTDHTKKLVVSSRSVEGYIPKKENTVRVPMSNATWVVTAESDTRLRVNYTLQVEPGGSVSPWMINMVSDEGPFESFRDLRKRFK